MVHKRCLVLCEAGLPRGPSGKELPCQCKRHQRHGFNPWRRKGQPTPVLLPGKSHWPRILVCYSPRGHKGLDVTEQLSTHTHTHTHTHVWHIVVPQLTLDTIMIIVIRAKLLTREGETLGGGGVAGRSMQTSYKRTLIIKISLPWRSSNRS